LGSINFFQGDSFKGHFKDGRACGYGILKYMRSLPGSNGAEFEEATYEGNFKSGKREGFGVISWADGSQFRGTWKNDQRVEGDMLMASGNIYRGRFSNDKFSGQAMYMLSN